MPLPPSVPSGRYSSSFCRSARRARCSRFSQHRWRRPESPPFPPSTTPPHPAEESPSDRYRAARGSHGPVRPAIRRASVKRVRQRRPVGDLQLPLGPPSNEGISSSRDSSCCRRENALAALHQAGVLGNAKDPRLQPLGLAKLIEIFKDLQQRLLRDFLGVLPMAAHHVRVLEDSSAVARDKDGRRPPSLLPAASVRSPHRIDHRAFTIRW